MSERSDKMSAFSKRDLRHSTKVPSHLNNIHSFYAVIFIFISKVEHTEIYLPDVLAGYTSVLACLHLIKKILRQYRSCFIMLCKHPQRFIFPHPILKKLRRSFSEISLHREWPLACYVASAQHRVHQMSKLMKQSNHI